MATRIESTEMFISAIEMEHPENGEFFDRTDKIRAAIERQVQKKHPEIELVRIFLEKTWFDPTAMGYRALVKIIT